MKKSKTLKRRLFAALMLAVIHLAPQTANAAAEKLPYLIYEGVNTDMTVLWQMTTAESCTIKWGPDTNYTTGSFTTTEYGDDHQHKYSIPNLTPGTKYYYNVVGVGSGSFRAAPADSATAVKFIAFGDTRTNPTDHNDVATEMINTYTSDPAFETVALCSGDYTGSDSEAEWSSGWFNPNLTSLATFNSNMPISGCRGNHEGDGYRFKKYYPYPYVDKFYWSYDYGPVHVIVLDEYTDYSVGSPQYNWLVADLEANTKQWIFMMYHAPAWSAGGHGNDTQAQLSFQPLAQQYGVDLMIAGDNHYYSRHDVNGIQHVTTGGAGAPLRSPSQSADYLVFAEEVNHHCEISVDGDVLTFVARRVDGSVMDSYTRTDAPAAPAWNTDPVVAKVAAPTLKYAEKLNKFVVDPNGDPLTFTKISGPAWLTVASDGSLSGTPSLSELGLNSFVIEAADGISGSETATVNIPVAVQATSEAEDAELSGSTFSSHSSGYTGTGYAVMKAAGSYIEWTVASTAAIPHEISFRSETDGDNIMTITVNGVVVDSNYTLAETSGWGFSSVATVLLNPGANTIRLTRVRGPNAIRMDHLLLTETSAAAGSPVYIADTISKSDVVDGSETATLNITAGSVVSASEAEDAELSDSTVGTSTSGYTGTGYAVMTTAGSSYVEWTLNRAAAGSFDLSFRHYTNRNQTMSLTVNGVVVDSAYALNKTSGAWDLSRVASVSLNAGSNTVRLTRESGRSHLRMDHLLVEETP